MLSMRSSIYGTACGVIFLAIAVLHGYGAHFGWVISYGAYVVPEWQSWMISLVGFLMALTSIRFLR
jgi:hypothetical protein